VLTAVFQNKSIFRNGSGMLLEAGFPAINVLKFKDKLWRVALTSSKHGDCGDYRSR